MPKRHLFLFFVILAMVRGISSVSFASGVANSSHDMYFMGKGTDPNVCSYCHVPHKAAGDKIWSTWGNEAQLTSGPSTKIGNMCYTCHDGTVTSIGITSVFNSAVQQHKISTGQDCDMCHVVHDNVNGKFMGVVKTQDSYCAACHNNTVNAGGFGDMTGAGNHQSYWPTTPNHYGNYAPYNTSCVRCHNDSDKSDDGSCNLCHSIHSAGKFTTPKLTNPVLKAAGTNGYCERCHSYEQNNSLQKAMHPAGLTFSRPWGVVACQECHNPHQPDKPNNPKLLLDQNVNSAFCKTCHDKTSTSKGPSIGDSHPEDVSYSVTPMNPALTPAGNAIDDDGKNGPDYLANSANIICESCHSVHLMADKTGTKLLRINNASGQLCNNCHTDK